METGASKSPDEAGKGRPRPFLRWARVVISLLEWSGRIIAAATLGFMFVALLVNVVLRYAFGSGIAWAYEIHALLLPWLVAGGIVIAAARGRNIAITILPELLGPAARRVLVLAIQVAILVISVSVLESSWPILKASTFQTLSTLGIKQVWGYASLVYAFAGMAVIAALNILRALAGSDVMDHDPEHASLS
jgi:TRAP-type C4-dicarboxylate transport system permease small subunit